MNEKGGRWPTCSPACRKWPATWIAQAIERLTDPANYLGMAPQMVDRVLAGRR